DEIESVQREVSEQLAAEEGRLATAASEEPLDALHDEAQGDESQADQDGDDTAEPEEETVPRAGEKAAKRLGGDAGVDGGGELADEIDGGFQDTEGGEEPSAPDHDLQADDRIE